MAEITKTVVEPDFLAEAEDEAFTTAEFPAEAETEEDDPFATDEPEPLTVTVVFSSKEHGERVVAAVEAVGVPRYCTLGPGLG